MLAAFTLQRLLQFVEQVVEGQQALGRLACRQLLVELADQAYLQVDQALLGLGLRRIQRIAEFLQRGSQGIGRGFAALFAGLVQAFAGQAAMRFGLAEQCRRIAEITIQLSLPDAQLGRVAHIALEAVEGLELRQPGGAFTQPAALRLLPGGAQGAHLAAGTGLRLDTQIGPAQVIAQTLAQNLRGDLLLHQKRRPFRLGRRQLMPPEVGEQGIDDLAIVMGQLVVEITTGLERGILQGTLTETMNGEDRRLIEAMHRQQQTPMAGRIRILGTQIIQQLIIARAVVVHRQQLGQALANALAQLGGGGGGKGHHQNLADAEPLLQQQTGVQGGQGPGLAGTGAGLDQRAPAEAVLQQVKAGAAHASSSSLPCRASRAGP